MATTFLATVIGWYLIIMSIYVLVRCHQAKEIMHEVMENRGLLLFINIMTVILGLLMVTSHNIWDMGWPIVITLISWLVLIVGIIRLMCLETAVKMGKAMLTHSWALKVVSIVMLIIGLFLLYHVYFA